MLLDHSLLYGTFIRIGISKVIELSFENLNNRSFIEIKFLFDVAMYLQRFFNSVYQLMWDLKGAVKS